MNGSVYVDPAIECSFLHFYQLLIVIGLLWMFLLHCSDKLNIHEWDICLLEYLLIPEENMYLKLIQDSVSAYKPCPQESCNCYSSVIDKDLSPFKSGITKDMINSVMNK